MIIVYDIGTTVLKAAVFDDDARMAAFESRRIDAAGDYEKAEYGVKVAGLWQEAFAGVTSALISACGCETEIEAAVVSGNGPTLVPAGGGRLLAPVLAWMDRRAGRQSAEINKYQDFYIDPGFYLPKALWIAQNQPEVYEKTEYFLSCPESIIYLLTGEAVTILPGSGFEKYYWNSGLLDSLSLDSEKFPAFRKPGYTAGRVTAGASKRFGLPEGVPVIAAGPDFILSQLGSAAVYPGRACDRSGTSEGVNLCTERDIPDTRLMSYGHVAEPWYNLSGIISASGKALEWARGVFGSTDESLLMKQPRPTGLVFLPYLAGERAPVWDPDAKGAFIGLGFGTTAGHMKTAVMESTGFAIRDVLEVMAENGAECDELRITGGPAANGLWNQIKADITGKRILVPESPAPELSGCFLLAQKALGKVENLSEAADRFVRIKSVYEPDISKYNEYTEIFMRYRESYRMLKPLFKEM